MKFKNLLSLSVMLSCGLVSQAQQVFQEPFDAAQSKGASDVAFYEFINQEEGDDWKISDTSVKGKSLGISNSSSVTNDNATWRRAIKFRNLPLQEGKSYRLTYYFKGSNTYKDANEADQKTKARVSLMQGVENADIPVNGSQADITDFSDDFKKYTHVFYFKSKADQDAEYDKQCSGKEAYDAANKDKYFAAFNIYNPGDFNLDEVVLEEAAIAGIIYKEDVICVDFGHATNAATLAKAKASGIYTLDNSTATVTVDGKAAEILSVELRADGKLYIFLADAISGGEVKVTFKNPDGLVKCDDGFELKEFAETAVLDSEFNSSGDIYSGVYSDPALEAATPLDGSFGLETKDIKTITLTFDREVYVVKNDNKPAPKATLSTGAALTLKTTGETSKTLTFEYSGAELPKGTYTIKVENIVSAYNIEGQDITLTYEFGKVQLAQTEYTLLADKKTVAEEGGIPEGWTLMVGETKSEGGSGARCFAFENSNVQAPVYMRDWEGKAVLTADPVKIEKGDVEIRVFTGGWKGAGAFNMKLKDAAGNEVLAEKISVSTQFGGVRSGNLQVDTYRFVSDGGEYTFTIELVEGYNELMCGGFEVYSYKEGVGDKVQTEVIAKSDFGNVGADYAPEHGTGWKVYRNDGRMRDPGANCNWGGDCWTGGGGPRIKNLSNKGMTGSSIYLGGGCYATYGEFDVQTDHGGPLAGNLEEKTLDLDAARYQISYNFIGWKEPGENNVYNIQLDIYKQADGINGTPVYTRIDGTKVCCGSGGDASGESTRVQFLWNAPEKGKYILKFTASGTGEGEVVVGNVSVETTASLAVQYADEMRKRLEPANEELAKAKADEKYKGATRDALENTIKDYTNPDFHTPDEYTKAFAAIDAIVKKSEKRRSNIDGFPTALEAVKNGLDAAQDTKFESLPQFPIVEKAYNDYKDVDYIALDDDALDAAVSVMNSNGNLLKNMVETCVPLITKQITDLAAAIVALDAEAETKEESVIAAGNAITDNQKLVSKLKYVFASKLYKQIATGNPFVTKDAETGEEVESEIPASFLIQNADFYNTAVIPAGKQSVEAKVTDFPGWTIEIQKGTISPVFNTAWGESGASDVKPYSDNAVRTTYGDREYDVKQFIEDIPVAKYTASIVVGEDGSDPHGSYAYLGEGENQKQIAYEGTEKEDGTRSYDRGSSTPQEFVDVVPEIYNNNFGSLTIGAHVNVTAGFGSVDKASLVIKGKADNFDYAKAAAAIDELLATSIEAVEAAPAGEPSSVRYYTVDGKLTLNPQGITIKVESWANGYVKVSKVVK